MASVKIGHPVRKVHEIGTVLIEAAGLNRSVCLV